MAAKFIVFSLLVASVYGSGGYSSFSYGVSDPNTGDVKDQHEKRVGDSVVGKYSLLESDGTKRVVEYSANEATGFNAVVRKEPGVGGPGAAAALAQNAALSGAAPAVHPASLGPAAALAHGGPYASRALGYPGALAHGALNPGALAHGALAPGALAHGALAPGALAHGAIAPGALAHGALSSGALSHGALAPGALGHGTLANPLAHSGALSHGALASAALANPHVHSGAFSSGALANPIAHSGVLSHGALANPLSNGLGNFGYPGYAGAGYANPLAGSLGARGAPTVSHYSHSIVHDPARPYGGPYAGAYGGYGGYGAAAPGLVNPAGLGPLAHGVANPLANGWPSPLANGANGWPSPAANGVYGAQGLGARLGW